MLEAVETNEPCTKDFQVSENTNVNILKKLKDCAIRYVVANVLLVFSHWALLQHKTMLGCSLSSAEVEGFQDYQSLS